VGIRLRSVLRTERIRGAFPESNLSIKPASCSSAEVPICDVSSFVFLTFMCGFLAHEAYRKKSIYETADFTF
jgi:hypothetical protein